MKLLGIHEYLVKYKASIGDISTKGTGKAWGTKGTPFLLIPPPLYEEWAPKKVPNRDFVKFWRRNTLFTSKERGDQARQ